MKQDKSNLKNAEEQRRRLLQAQLKKPSKEFVKAHGLSRQETQKIYRLAHQNDLRTPPKKLTKVFRDIPIESIRELLETPVISCKNAVEYKTPAWFRSTEKADVSIIVPLYKSPSVINDQIDTWEFDHNLKVEIIYVDDCCPLDSKNQVLRSWDGKKTDLRNPIGRIYCNPQNLGFGPTCNVGAEHATGDYLVFLNADTVTTPGWLSPIIELFEDKSVGIVGNLQLKKGGMWDETVDGAGSEWSWGDKSFMHLGRHIYKGKHLAKPCTLESLPKDMKIVAEREMVTGCCLAIRRSLFQDIGGFNVNYRVGYWEDSEICLTVREKGYKVMFQPNSIIYHQLGHSNSSNHKYQEHNRLYFFNKWVNSGRIDPLVKCPRPYTPPLRSILLRRSGANGDVLLAAGVASALKKRHNCKILFCTNCPEVLKKHPFIDRVVAQDDISDRMAQVYYNLDLCYEYRPFTNILESYAEAVGVPVKDCTLSMHTEPIPILNSYVVIHAGRTGGANWVGRQWSPDKFVEIAKRLQQLGNTVVCVGSSVDYPVPSDMDLRGQTSLSQLAYVISKAKLFIGIDSLPLHICQTFNVPGVCFFGSIDPKSRLIRDNIVPVQATKLSCLGCHHRQPTPCTVTNVCLNRSQDCVNLVDVDHFWKEVKESLINNKRYHGQVQM